jgi:hypothetical protein
MRMSKVHKVVVTAVVTTIAAAAVLTFTRGDTATADRIAALPDASHDSPLVAGRTPGATTKPTPSASATTPSPKAGDPATQAPKPVAKTSVEAVTPTTNSPAPTTKPAPSPSPTPTEKNLLEILLGQ